LFCSGLAAIKLKKKGAGGDYICLAVRRLVDYVGFDEVMSNAMGACGQINPL